MEDIIGIINTYKEDHPEVIITKDMIKEVIIENIDKIVDEISNEINQFDRYDNSFDKMFDDSLDKLDKLTIRESEENEKKNI